MHAVEQEKKSAGLDSAVRAIRPQMQQLSVRQPAQLSAIFRDDVNLMIWQRPIQSCLDPYVSAWPATLKLQRILTLTELPQKLPLLLPQGAAQSVLAADVMLAAQMLGCLMDTETIGVRLSLQQQPQCPNWHTDHVMLRLLVSYGGPGTEYLPCPAPTGAGRATQRACQIGSQHLALLKGSAWTGDPLAAIWHRSPRSEVPRLVLTLDPL